MSMVLSTITLQTILLAEHDQNDFELTLVALKQIAFGRRASNEDATTVAMPSPTIWATAGMINRLSNP
jgi:hypothetical protein